MGFLVGVFGVEVMGVAVMSGQRLWLPQPQLVPPSSVGTRLCLLRTRPDVVAEWSDEEVARRRWELFPRRRNVDGSAVEPAETDLNAIISDAATLAERRMRLSSVSWFMRCMSEVIARMANAEDECTSRF